MNHRFFSIIDELHPANDLLKEACQQRNIEFHEVWVDEFDFTKKSELKEKDILYRISIKPTVARLVEKFLINEKVTTFYSSFERSLVTFPDTYLLCEKNGVPMPKTVFQLDTDREKLFRAVEYVGGFPVIIKALGGHNGVGVMKIDSFASLASVVDYLIGKDPAGNYILRQFIHSRSHARLIVLGDTVIDSIEYIAPDNDFRTNASTDIQVQPKKYSEEIEQLAVQSTHARGVEFGGVDIMIDDNQQPYILEVNFPCYFPRAQNITGTDIAGMMVDYLMNKSKDEQI